MNTQSWDEHVESVWSRAGEFTDEELVEQIERLAAECPHTDGTADFERAGSYDAIDRVEKAIPLYRAALGAGLAEPKRRQAVIQLASSLRNVGGSAESVELLTRELEVRSDELDDAARAFLALALTDVGREREAVSLLVKTLQPHLALYGRALGEYADLLGQHPAPDAG